MAENGNQHGDDEFKDFLRGQPGPPGVSTPEFVLNATNNKLDRLTNALRMALENYQALTENDPMRAHLAAFVEDLTEKFKTASRMYEFIMYRELDVDDGGIDDLGEGDDGAK